MTKYHYHATHKIRVRVKYNRSENVIELKVQRYRNWWTGWVNYNDRIDIELGEYPDREWQRHPMVMDYQLGGHREIWDQARFNLQERIETLLTQHAAVIDKQTTDENYIKSIL